jgi:putative phosphoesterase
MIRAGILSDTHLPGLTPEFKQLAEYCFAGCDTIIHAGDLTDISLLSAFGDKTVYAVHGNMCGSSAYTTLPDRLLFELGRFSIGLTHGAGLGHDIESALWDVFPEADCMIYGHTHRPVCHTIAGKLIINPGSFQETGRYGAPGTYAVLEISNTLQAAIHEVPQLP